MKKEIAFINIHVPGFEVISYSKLISLLDYDIPIFHIDYIIKQSGNADDRFKEIFNFLGEWRNVFIILWSGAEEIIQKKLWVEVDGIRWKKIKICDSLFGELYDKFGELIEYKWYLSNEYLRPIYKTIKWERVVWWLLNYSKWWKIVILPDLDFEDKKFETPKWYWTQEAIRLWQLFVQEIIKIDKNLSLGEEKTSPPKRAEDKKFLLKTEVVLLEQREEFKRQKEEVENQIRENDLKLQQELILRDLLFEQWKPLENAVIEALKILWYHAKNYNDGKLEIDQIITSPEWYRYIWECEGKDNKAIEITKFRQLSDSIQEDAEREEVKEEAFWILFWNPERLSPLAERKAFFTQKCVDGAKRRSFGLIYTPDLFYVAKYVRENNDANFAKICRDEIHKQLWNKIEFPELPTK